MSNKWLCKQDKFNSVNKLPKNAYLLIANREIGVFSNHGKHFSFLRRIYFSMFPETTPRHIVIDRDKQSVKLSEFKFHPYCKNGC